MSGARLVLTMSANGFIRARSPAVMIPLVASAKRRCKETTSHSWKNDSLLLAAA
jgi:hypothetical protein